MLRRRANHCCPQHRSRGFPPPEQPPNCVVAAAAVRARTRRSLAEVPRAALQCKGWKTVVAWPSLSVALVPVPRPRQIAYRGGFPARVGSCESIMEARLCGATAVRHWRLRNRQNWPQTITEADVKEHPLTQHAKHFARFQIDHKKGLSALEFTWVFAFEADTGNDGAFMVTKTNSEAHQFVSANDLIYRPNGAHSNVNLFCN